MTRYIALLRGVKVGKAKRVPMADLRELMTGLGLSDIRTLLNSGNVVFSATPSDSKRLARAIESVIQRRFGFAVPVIVLSARDLDQVVAMNPLRQAARDPARFLVAFVASASTLEKARGLLQDRWAPEALALGEKAAYLWCALGLIESRLWKAFGKATADANTVRNFATVLKIQAEARHPQVGRARAAGAHNMRSTPKSKPRNIDEYLAGLTNDKRAALQKLRKDILAAAPGAVECISYGMPAFKLNGRMLAWIGAATHHCSFYPGGIVDSLESELAGYSTSKGTIRFAPDKPLPTALVKKVLKAKLASRPSTPA